MNLVMYRGDDRDFPFTITKGGAALSLSGATVVFTAREAIDDVDPAFTLSSAVVAGTGFEIDIAADQDVDKGEVIVHVPASATVDYTDGLTLFCDVEVTDADGKVFTYPEADDDQSALIRLKVRADVTQP